MLLNLQRTRRDSDGDVGYYKLAKAAAYIRYGGAWRGHGGTNTPKKEAADADPGVLFVAVSDFEVQDSFVFSAIDHRAHTTLLAWPLDTTMAMLNPYAKQTNPDQASPLGPGGLIPGGGAFLSFLETACGREHDLCCGKPSKALGDAIKRQFEIKDPSKVMMWGVRSFVHATNIISLTLTTPQTLHETGPTEHGCQVCAFVLSRKEVNHNSRDCSHNSLPANNRETGPDSTPAQF